MNIFFLASFDNLASWCTYNVHCLYSRTPKHLEHKLTLELEFRSLLSTCTLLYSHQDEDGLGDFLSLALIQGFVELRYNLGDGFVAIKSFEPVQLGTWNRIVVKRLVYGVLIFPVLYSNFKQSWFVLQSVLQRFAKFT